VARMKFHREGLRVIMVSATVPNIEDVASWVGNCAGDGPAAVFQVSERIVVSRHIPIDVDCMVVWGGVQEVLNRARSLYCSYSPTGPCKLTRHVVSVPRQPNQNDWVFASALDQRLFPTLQQYAANKPILILSVASSYA
jgi:ATP-dependent DNA helicase HFM1/MER3